MSDPIRCPRCGAVADGSVAWCGRCLAPLPAAESARIRPQAPPVRDPMPAPVYSRWRTSDTSFGPVGRALLTLAAIVGLVIGEPMLRGFILASVGFDVPGTGFVIFYVAIAVPAFAYLASRIWRRVRVA